MLKNNLFVSKAEVHALVGSIPTLHRKVGSFKLFKEEVIKSMLCYRWEEQ